MMIDNRKGVMITRKEKKRYRQWIVFFIILSIDISRAQFCVDWSGWAVFRNFHKIYKCTFVSEHAVTDVGIIVAVGLFPIMLLL